MLDKYHLVALHDTAPVQEIFKREPRAYIKYVGLSEDWYFFLAHSNYVYELMSHDKAHNGSGHCFSSSLRRLRRRSKGEKVPACILNELEKIAAEHETASAAN